MRSNNKHHPGQEKNLARQKYAERQIDKWWKWSWDVKGYVKYKDLVKLQERHNIKAY
jgi:hypothetical protein